MALTTTIRASIRAAQTGTLDLEAPGSTAELSYTDTLSTGVAVDQADLKWSDTRTLAASATENLDLSGVLVDALGTTLAFVEITSIEVTALAANTNNVVLGNGTAPVIGGPFGVAGANTIDVHPNGMFAWHSPKNPAIAVTATTADILKVANSGGGTGVTYSIVIVGRSA